MPVHDHTTQLNKNYSAGASGANSDARVGRLIKCCVCKSMKPKEHFSNRQIAKYISTEQNKYAPAGRTLKDPKTTCRQCTGKQVEELECIVCGIAQSLDKFGKTQRKQPDRARCLDCVEYHANVEPGMSPPTSDYEGSGDEVCFIAKYIMAKLYVSLTRH
ncbi:Stc1 domain-containing protein [Geopyxis carbonaria]|nr:Stc1 domain-containing protein [Geopyxis carbonaria]